MKRISFFALALAMALLAMPAHSQLFIVGTTGLDLGSNKTITTSNATTPAGTITAKTAKSGLDVEFNLNAGLGYQFSHRFAIGGTIGYQLIHESNVGEILKKNLGKTQTNFNLFNFHPFARITAFRTSNVSFYIDFAVPLSVGKGTQKSESLGIVTKADVGTMLNLGLTITPGIAFHISQSLSLFANLRFMQVGYNYTLIKQPPSAYATSKVEAHDFYLGTLHHKGLGFGVLYKF